jgi:hypothetical protein
MHVISHQPQDINRLEIPAQSAANKMVRWMRLH